MPTYLWVHFVAVSVLLAATCSDEGPPQRFFTKAIPTEFALTPTLPPLPTASPSACVSPTQSQPHTPSADLLRAVDYSLEVEVEESVENEARIWMTIKITNTTDREVELALGGIPWYFVRITTPDCEPIWHWPEILLLPITYFRLPAGETIWGRKDWYGLNGEGEPVRAGTYVVSAFISLGLSDSDPNTLIAGAEQFTVTKRFLANAPEPTATPVPPTPVPFEDRIIEHGECRHYTWVKPPTDEEIWAVINKHKDWLSPDPRGIAVPGNMDRFYGSEYTLHRGVVVYIREGWISDNREGLGAVHRCYEGVPIEIRAFEGARPQPVSDHIDPKTGKMPVTDHDSCKSSAYGANAPFPPAANDQDKELRGIEFFSERIAWYVPIDVRITMRNTTGKVIQFDANKDGPNVQVYRPDDCELLRTFKHRQDLPVSRTLQPYEIVEWIVEWPRADEQQWDDNRFLLYPTFTFITEGKRWQWVGSGMQVPRER